MDTLVEEIVHLAKRDYNGDFTKAATDYFVKHPWRYVVYKRENSTFVGNKLKDSIRSEAEIRADLEFQAEQVANRKGLDFNKIEDSIKARVLVFEENPTLYEEYRKVNKS